MRRFLLVAFISGFACASEVALKGGLYSTNLEECNRNAKTLCESIACENHYRSAAGRFPRGMPAHCKDAGGSDGSDN